MKSPCFPAVPGGYDYGWLVVDLPLWKIMEFVSWDDDIPNIWKNVKMIQTINQMAIYQNHVYRSTAWCQWSMSRLQSYLGGTVTSFRHPTWCTWSAGVPNRLEKDMSWLFLKACVNQQIQTPKPMANTFSAGRYSWLLWYLQEKTCDEITKFIICQVKLDTRISPELVEDSVMLEKCLQLSVWLENIFPKANFFAWSHPILDGQWRGSVPK